MSREAAVHRQDVRTGGSLESRKAQPAGAREALAPAGHLNASPLSIEQVVSGQRSVGNQAVLRLLRQRRASPGSANRIQRAAAHTDPSSELSDSPPGSTPTERVFSWLRKHGTEIAAQEAQFGVDRRAIAGAIAWEALENYRSGWEHLGGRFVGAAKPHVKQSKWWPAVIHTGENVPQEVEEAGLLPHRSVIGRELTLKHDSIPYVAAGMRMASDIARAYGKDISSDPAMLTWFWQSKDANSFIQYWSTKRNDTFNPTAETMPKWVVENLSWLTAAVGNPALKSRAEGDEARQKVGTMETESWKGTFSLDARLPETREFLVRGGRVTVNIGAYSEIAAASGYPVSVVLHRRQDGSDVEVGDTKRVDINKGTDITWSGLSDGLYFLEIFSFNGVHLEGELAVELPNPAETARAGSAPPAVQAGSVQVARQAKSTAPDIGASVVAAEDGGTKAASLDEGILRANAARTLVQRLHAKAAVYGHELAPNSKDGPRRKDGWWWDESEFDCSKFVLWVLAGRQVGDPSPAPDESKASAIRDVTAAPFGAVSDASSVAGMRGIVEQLAKEGKTEAIDKDRAPRVGDLMFWGGHVAIVVELQPARNGDAYIVYANMGVTGAGLVGVDQQGSHWLKVSEVEKQRKLASGSFLGYWSP